MELMKASNQWANRPADERFASLQDMYDATKAYAQASREKIVPFTQLRTDVDGGEVVLVGKGGNPAKLTNWSFGQLCVKAEAPASYLRRLPATLAVQNLNHGIKRNEGTLTDANVYIHVNGHMTCRAVTTEKYARIYNHEVIDRLLPLPERGWTVPRAYRSQESDNAGLYASDHDMFAFLVNNENRINDGSEEGLGRGFFVRNSEVGASSLSVTYFLFRYVCGNHIVWGAQDVREIAVRHIGSARDRMDDEFLGTITQYANESVSDLEAKISKARTVKLGKDKDAVLDLLFGKRLLSRKTAEASYDAVLPDVDGDPRSLYGMIQGVTRVSQASAFADDRNDLDRAAGKMMQMVDSF